MPRTMSPSMPSCSRRRPADDRSACNGRGKARCRTPRSGRRWRSSSRPASTRVARLSTGGTLSGATAMGRGRGVRPKTDNGPQFHQLGPKTNTHKYRHNQTHFDDRDCHGDRVCCAAKMLVCTQIVAASSASNVMYTAKYCNTGVTGCSCASCVLCSSLIKLP